MVDAEVAIENAEGEIQTENVEVPIENVEVDSGNDSTEDENNDSENKLKMSLQEVVKKIVINPNGWGPVSIPESFRCLPYQAFDKSERISKIADWTGQLSREERRYGQGRYAAANANAAASTNQYAYYHEEEETAFQLVDGTRTTKSAPTRNYRLRQLQLARRQMQKDRERQSQTQASSKHAKNREKDRHNQWRVFQKAFRQRQRYDRRGQKQVKSRLPSVLIKPEWEMLEEFDLAQLQKMNLPSVDDGEDIENERYGTLEYYERSFDRITGRNEVKLRRFFKSYYTISTTDDPVIERLAKNPHYTVFATDVIIATLMCCTRSVYPWDIVIHRIGNKLFFDKRSTSKIDFPTVSETAIEPPQDEGNSINSPHFLALEAMFVNQNFKQQVLKSDDEKYAFEHPDVPFVDENDPNKENVASIGYRYRTWDLGNDVNLVIRCEHDGVMKSPENETQFLTIKAFNEWDYRFSGGIEWRSKIDTQRGAVLATELKNNSCKLAKWTVQALLAGSHYLKFGYISRIHTRDTTQHVILSTQQFRPAEFANQINLNMDNAWGILRCFIDKCLELPSGKYLLMKDPNKPVMLLYKVPPDSFENEEEDQAENNELEEQSRA
ncbi:Eukaryotic translation initiation factor 3 subunit D [Trichinella zimbabwensis]|uniref:Eukaryotic translation initiation factor 3 subunit D n=1 Tax=Trichinella zimbabwensis TaxID=268475 RepID=A0A0V1I293_9BILA|nr:Eukaryotic translation initiation factor 3 subunit D [Trichinella zimbabwensis]